MQSGAPANFKIKMNNFGETESMSNQIVIDLKKEIFDVSLMKVFTHNRRTQKTQLQLIRSISSRYLSNLRIRGNQDLKLPFKNRN